MPMTVMEAAAPNTIRITEKTTPVPSTGEVRIRTAYCGMCATDVSMIAGSSRLSFPFVLGHEWSGYVDAVGPGCDEEIIGSACVADNVRSDGNEVGFEHPGGYGEYFLTDIDNLLLLPQGANLRTAVLVEPIAVCVRAVRRLSPQPNQPILIFGDGPIGLLMTHVLKLHGFHDIALVGGRTLRLQQGLALGAQHAANYHDADDGNLAEIVANTGNRKYPLIVEASGASSAIIAAIELAAPGCKILLIGDYEHTHVPVPWQHLLHHEISLIPSNASGESWPEAARLYRASGNDLESMVTHSFDARSQPAVEQGLSMTESGHSDMIKGVIRW